MFFSKPLSVRESSSTIRGFSLIELLVVIAIIGILAAVGVPMYQDYLEGVKLEDAKQGLASIYMMEEQYKSMDGSYYIGTQSCCSQGSTNLLTQNLFGGKQSLNEDHYWYAVQRRGTSDYIAHARKHNGSGNICVDNFNRKSWSAPTSGGTSPLRC